MMFVLYIAFQLPSPERVPITDQIVEGTNDVKKVLIKAWDAENGPVIIDSGESTYNTTAKKFSLKYTIGNTLYEEQLTKEKEVL